MIAGGEAGMPGRVPVTTPPPTSAPSITSAMITAKVASSIRCNDGVWVAIIALRTQ